MPDYAAATRTIQVKNVPNDVYRIWYQRAAAEGMSVQEFLLGKLTREARRPSATDLMERIEHREGVPISCEEAAALIRADRDGG
jgi:hypothetical protein